MTRFWVILFVLCLTLGVGPTIRAQPPFVVILLPGTSLPSWQAADAPHLHQLMASGALAVMNTRTARLPNDHSRETPQSAALTLGAGARAAGSPEAVSFLPPSAIVMGQGVSAGDLWVRRTGGVLPSGRNVNVRWGEIRRANEALGYRIQLGALADMLAFRHVRAIAGGGPVADWVAASGDGSVFRITAPVSMPGQCLIWDAGPDVPAADDLIGTAAAQVRRLHGRLLIMSAFASNADFANGRRLTPILEWGDGVPPGLLRSPSTRRAGLVTNTDFAPTVGAFYGIRREDFRVRPFGETWTAVPAPEHQRAVRALEEQAVRQAQGMKILPYAAIALTLWMLMGTALALQTRISPIWPIFPPALVLTLLFSNSFLSVVLWLSLFLALGGLLAARRGPTKTTLLLLVVLASALVLDILTGNRLMQRGLLGYSAVEGARYYGIGNEAMGAMIGALIVLVARLWQPFGRGRWMLLLLLGIVAVLLGSASAGAKAGGLLVSLAAFGTLSFALLRGRWSARMVLLLAMGVVAAMCLMAVADAFSRHGTHSHIGEAVQRIQAGGWSEAGDIAARKLAVDGRLAYHSLWACPLWGGLACLALLWRKQVTGVPEEQALHVAGMVAVAACVAFNDAGIVAGALCLVPLWCDSVLTKTKKTPGTTHLVPGATV